ncbi:MAG: Protein-S-isoprenylcysteine O-methyltransferase Ste14 [Candidatus Kentron sp. G]|nr:MAG: Protein-S-isoprenylcysteine O-methyltransferase Ste14 [Candidatus Kentron sp. G]VFN06997.1 MAG: Protein-S-isoprenylcysteine O-methyltransferase Ste14 [Candidatus Kentron sp. G]
MCGRTARTVRREGRAKTRPYPYPEKKFSIFFVSFMDTIFLFVVFRGQKPMKKALAALSVVIGAVSLTVFTLFLFTGPFPLVDLPLGVAGGLVFDAGLCFVFFLQHSAMIRSGTRDRIRRWIPEHWFRALFSLVSGAVLLAFVALWQESPVLIASAEGIFRWLLRGVFFLALAGQIWMLRTLQEFDVFGAAALQRGNSPPPPAGEILTTGPYGWVRHPAYFTTLVMIWAYPDLTVDRVVLIFLFTVWIIAGTRLEERDLVAVHGQKYRAYQRAVPMLIPYRGPCRSKAPHKK